jgi:2-oxo-3-hexenedioate decarboxylase
VTPGDAARRVIEAYDSVTLIEPLTDADPDLDEARAYEIASAVHAQRVARGERPIGRKIGFTNRTVWPLFGVERPNWAWVYDTTTPDLGPGPWRLDLSRVMQPRIEPEIQLHFARTPPPGAGEAEILRCVDWLAHGFEIVQCPFPGWRFKLADSIAAYVLHGFLVVGPAVPVESAPVDEWIARLRDFTIELSCDGAVVARGGGADVLDSPVLAFAHLASVLAAQGAEPVRAGEVVTTGTLTNAMPIAPGQTWTTAITGLDVPDAEIAFCSS